MKRLFFFQSIFIITLFVTVPSIQLFSEETEVNTNPLSAQLSFKPQSLPPGSNGEIVIDIVLDPEFHAYLDRFKIETRFTIGELKIDPIVEFHDTVSNTIKKGVRQKAQLRTSFEIPENEPLKSGIEKIFLTYQACTVKFCLFPKTLELSGNIKVENISSIEKSNPFSIPYLSSTNQLEEKLKESLFLALLIVFILGLASSLTPCTYPMIPITMAILGTRNKSQSHLKSFLLSHTYVLGIALTYSILGMVAAKTGALFGSALGNPWVIFPMALIFVIMGLSMYGLFEIQAPGFIRNWTAKFKTDPSYLSSFLAGILAGVVASPCLGPVLVTILTFVAQTQNLFLGFFLLFFFSLGLGTPYLLLGTFTHIVKQMPKAGPWMNMINFIFGTLMILMALYFVKPLIEVKTFSVLLTFTFILISYFFSLFMGWQEKRSLAHKLFQTTFISIILFGLVSLSFKFLKIENPLFKNETQLHGSHWPPYSKIEIERALNEKKPVLIDFQAEWCVACLELATYTFSDPQVIEFGKNFILLQVDATTDSEMVKQLKNEYEILGLPTVIFIDSNGKVRKELTLTGFEPAPKFLERMKLLINQE